MICFLDFIIIIIIIIIRRCNIESPKKCNIEKVIYFLGNIKSVIDIVGINLIIHQYIHVFFEQQYIHVL